ncbi:coiled-coil domain-containing protein mad1 [Tulasnella sp. 419]|nr:coiled-coil domain-containing protein mad1 [Tulasnella sp. 419]
METRRNVRAAREATSSKRDSFAAQLDQDPQLSTAKRTQRSDLFSSKMATKSLERRLLALEESKQELENTVKEKEVAIERLENDRRFLAQREQEEREEKERVIGDWANEKRTLEKTVRSLRSNFTMLESEHGELQDKYSDLQRTTSSTIALQKSSLATLERRVALLEEELVRSKELATRYKDTNQQLRDQLDELESEKESHPKKEEDNNWSVIREELSRQSSYMKSLESTNTRLQSEVISLRARQTSIEVLREEKRDLERKLLKAQEDKERVVKLESELDAARREREEWTSSLLNLQVDPGLDPSATITQRLSSLRLQHATLLEQHSSLQSLLVLRDNSLQSLQKSHDELKATQGELQATARLEIERRERIERKLKLSEREASGLRAILATYSAEEGAFHTPGAYDEQKSRRIEELERQIVELKESCSLLETELENALQAKSIKSEPDIKQNAEMEEELSQARQRIEELEAELAEATQEIDTQQDKVETLEQKLYELGCSINSGNHIPPNTQVVQFKNNPISEDINLRKETFERLKSENEALIGRIAKLEQGLGVGEGKGLLPQESWNNLKKERDDMIKTVADKEKRLLRLKQVFTAKTEEFREAVSSILGYTLFFQPTKIRLTSTYDISAAITFQLPRQGGAGSQDAATMKLLGVSEGGGPRINDLIQTWIVERESIPCFMAALTLDCFARMYPDVVAGTHHGDADSEVGVGDRSVDSMQMTKVVG